MNDDDLASLRQDARFARLVQAMRGGAGSASVSATL